MSATTAFILWGVDTGIRLIKRRRSKKKKSKEDVPEYEFSGNSNPKTQGGPKPIAYGLSRLSGYQIATAGTGSGIYLVSCGEIAGPIAGETNINGVYADDQPGSLVSTLATDFRPGGAIQDAFPGFSGDEPINSVQVSDDLKHDSWITLTSIPSGPYYADIYFKFPYGLFQARKNAVSSARPTHQRVISQVSSDGSSWVNSGDFYISKEWEQNNTLTGRVRANSPDFTKDLHIRLKVQERSEHRDGDDESDDYNSSQRINDVRLVRYETFRAGGEYI